LRSWRRERVLERPAARARGARRDPERAFPPLVGTALESLRAEVSHPRGSASGRARRARAPGTPARAPTVVVSAAVGGIVLGYETARQLGTFGIFVEKEAGVPTLRRGFALGPEDRAFVVEDVVTTGGSVREVFEVVRATGARVAGVGAIVRRAPVDFGVPTVALLDMPIESYEPETCPQCAAGEPLTEPGSRYLGSR
jgi:orotate phosphoribosyltransferase